jgi:hypothetical protein
VDGDGDFELPAGFYPAGTIFENDVHFQTFWQFAVDPATLNDPELLFAPTFDLIGIAAHEFGHSFGLHHTMITEIGGGDGTGSTLADGTFGIIGGRLARRSLHTEDEAWASYLYPEGSGKSGPRALQRGDVPFGDRYALIRGSVEDSQGNPVAGPSVFARNGHGGHGERSSSVVAGHVQLTYDPATDTLAFLPREQGVIDGEYELPVPKGLYNVGIESVDGFPYPSFVPAFLASMGWTAFTGAVYGAFFREEFWSGPLEGGAENSFGRAHPVFAFKKTKGVDFVIDDNIVLIEINDWDADPWIPAGIVLAVRVPRERIVAVDEGRGVLIQAGLFATYHFEAPKIPKFDAAMITTGRLLADGSARIDLRRPLVREAPFIAQDLDDSPLYVPNAKAAGDYVLKRMSPRDDIFLVLAVPAEVLSLPPPFEDAVPDGVSPLGFLADFVEPGEPFPPNSYYTFDGSGIFLPEPNFSLDFELVVAPRR